MRYSYDRRIEALTPQEQELLRLLDLRKSDRFVCTSLGVSLNEAIKLTQGIREKLKLPSGATLRGLR